MSLPHNLKSLRATKRMSQQALSDALGINRATYARYETGDNEPDYDTLRKIAEFHDVTIDFLVTGDADKDEPLLEDVLKKMFEESMRERKRYAELLNQYINGSGMTVEEISRACEKRGIKIHSSYINKLRSGERFAPSEEITRALAYVLNADVDKLLVAGYGDYANDYLKEMLGQTLNSSDTSQSSLFNLREASIPDSDMVQVPVLGSIRAGQPIEMIREMAPEYTFVEKAVVGTHEAFVLIVNGESLNGDNIHDGDRVVVIIGVDWTPSDICVVAINGDEATLKRVKQQGDICILLPSNPDMEPMVYPAKDVHVIGVVVEHRRKMR